MKKRYFIAAIASIVVLGLTYKFWLIFKTPTSAHFDFYPFCIILVLSYLGAFKLTDYLAGFKDTKHQSRIEFLFLLLFFVLLVIPMSHINSAAYSVHENRTLAKYIPLFKKDGDINYNYGKNFDSWFSDRFAVKQNLINLFFLIKVSINPVFESPKAIYISRTHWFLIENNLYPMIFIWIRTGLTLM